MRGKHVRLIRRPGPRALARGSLQAWCLLERKRLSLEGETTETGRGEGEGHAGGRRWALAPRNGPTRAGRSQGRGSDFAGRGSTTAINDDRS